MNDINISLFGLRRGGQHAIINWLAHHFDDPVWFFNDMRDFGNPHPILNDTGETDLSCYVGDPATIPDVWNVPKRILFQSYEDKSLNNLDFAGNEKTVGSSGKRVFVLMLRDPFNTIASRMCHPGSVFVMTPEWVNMWKQYAWEAMGRTSFLPNRVFIAYNRWFKNPDYRRQIEKRMGLEESDEGIEFVTGVGSSFNGHLYDGRATEMAVEKRWEECKDHKVFRLVITDPEIWWLSDQLFGFGIAEPLRPAWCRP